MTSFYVGQDVWSSFFGKGKVVALRTDREDLHYPVVVQFNEDEFSSVMFTPRGSYHQTQHDPKMDIHPYQEDDHASLPVEWPGPVSRLLFSDKYESARLRLLYMGSSFAVGLIIGGLF